MPRGWKGNRKSGVALAMRHVVYPPTGSTANVWQMSILCLISKKNLHKRSYKCAATISPDDKDILAYW